MQTTPITFRGFINTYRDLLPILAEHGASVQNSVIDVYFKRSGGQYESKRLNNLDQNYEFPWHCVVTDVAGEKKKFEFNYSLLDNGGF